MAELAAEVGASEARAVRLRADALALQRDGVAAAFDPRAGEAAGSGDPGTVDARRRACTRAVAAQRAARRARVGQPAASPQRASA